MEERLATGVEENAHQYRFEWLFWIRNKILRGEVELGQEETRDLLIFFSSLDHIYRDADAFYRAYFNDGDTFCCPLVLIVGALAKTARGPRHFSALETTTGRSVPGSRRRRR